MSTKTLRRAACVTGAALICTIAAGCTPPGERVDADTAVRVVRAITDDDLRHAVANRTEWLAHGRTQDEQRHSPLGDIRADNVHRLGLAWHFDLDTRRGQEATPLMIDGVLYITTAWSKVYAIDARTGVALWQFDPEVPGEKAIDACCDVVNRGAAAWGGNLYFGTLDGRLIALDRATGEPVWSVQTTDASKRYTITGAPRIVKGNVIIGNGGAEMGVRGYVSSYDATTGALVWRFHTVPGNPADGFEDPAMEMAAATWRGRWWEYGGGGTAWDSFAYDPDLDLLYVGVGNGSPWNHQIRSDGEGDNLFLSSIVALRPDTGEYVWHFQTTPAESWDYTATQHMILADLEIDGRLRQVLMQAPKNGFFYVLDRATGEFISGRNFVPVNWTEGLDPETGRPIPSEAARYLRDPAIVLPGPTGAHNWYPMSFDPKTGLVFVPAQNTASLYAHDDAFEMDDLRWNLGQAPRPSRPPANIADAMALGSGPRASLLAWDPVAQAEVWRVDLPRHGNGGTLSTAGGLVFQGTPDGVFHAYHTTTGERLWQFDVQDAVIGGPIAYELDGVQYVAAMAGIGGVIPLAGGAQFADLPRAPNGRLLVFALDGAAELPPIATMPRQPPDLGDAQVSGNPVLGAKRYQQYCMGCHGAGAIAGPSMPDLRYSALLASPEAFDAVVLDGVLATRGMVGFRPSLSTEDSSAIHAWLVSESRRLPAAND
jgi:quinohemoprotein ethanol dehydrogenase